MSLQRKQRGFALVSALFLIVVIAALGVSIGRVVGSAELSSAADIRSARAYFAARSALDYAIGRITTTAACPPVNPPAIDGFTINISCNETAGIDEQGLAIYSVFDLSIAAFAGAKSDSSLIRRTINASVKNP